MPSELTVYVWWMPFYVNGHGLVADEVAEVEYAGLEIMLPISQRRQVIVPVEVFDSRWAARFVLVLQRALALQVQGVATLGAASLSAELRLV